MLLLVPFLFVGYICNCTNTGIILTNVSRQHHGFEIIWTTRECQMTGTLLGMKGVLAAPRTSLCPVQEQQFDLGADLGHVLLQ